MTMQHPDPAADQLETGELMRQDSPLTGEPIYTKMDHNILEALRERCIEGYKKIEYADGKTAWEPVIKYRDLYMMIMADLSHLGRTAYYEAKDSIIEWGRFKSTVLKPKAAKYHYDEEALDILEGIGRVRREILKGYASRGRGQLYDVKMAGSHRRVELDRGGGGKSIMDRLLGR